MQVGFIGLGRMGMNMARRLMRGGHTVVAYNRTREKTDQIVGEGAVGAFSLAELARRLTPPRVVWLMLPAGPVVDDQLEALKTSLAAGDVVVEGGNTYYQDDLRRAAGLKAARIRFVDVGVSGGIWGLEKGYCLMVGGPREAYEELAPLFQTLAPPEGHLYCGSTGAGHFVKMVHNGIEYALMQAYAEGFHILEASRYGPDLDYAQLSHLWNQGSVIRSWLLELAEAAFGRDGRLTGIQAYVEDSGEGRWTVEEAVARGVSAPVIALALMARFRSRVEDSFADRLLAALRREFGGHAVRPAE